MVHHFLSNFTQLEENILLHADNCVGQNKNNAMVEYLAWRIVTGLSATCELSFMISGHTKFSPDRFFGMIKRKYRRTKVDSLSQLAEMVNSSTLGQKNIAYVIGHDDTKPFTYYNWTEFLQPHFSVVTNITSYHHFRYTKSSPGSVFVREFSDNPEKEIKFLKSGHYLTKEVSPTISPTGLSKERQIYLYEQIRPFCQFEYRDITCPLPECHQESLQLNKDNEPSCSKRLCSYCRRPGHTKTKKGKVTCPSLLKEL